jgi:4-hydroxyacetophenone monooxygenase
VWDYLERCAREHGIVDAIRFETEALSAAFDEASCTWTVTVRDAQGRTEELRANILVPAVGQLTQPAIPPIPGSLTFGADRTRQERDSARWPADHVVGTGASGMQIGPAIARTPATCRSSAQPALGNAQSDT